MPNSYSYFNPRDPHSAAFVHKQPRRAPVSAPSGLPDPQGVQDLAELRAQIAALQAQVDALCVLVGATIAKPHADQRRHLRSAEQAVLRASARAMQTRTPRREDD